MIVVDRNPSSRHLRVFAWGLPVFFALIGTLRWHAGSPRTAIAVWAFGVVLSSVVLLWPTTRRKLYVAWMLALYPVAWIVSMAILVAIFALVATPTALLLRLLGRDPMKQRFDPEATTYWTPHRPSQDPDRHFRQF